MIIGDKLLCQNYQVAPTRDQLTIRHHLLNILIVISNCVAWIVLTNLMHLYIFSYFWTSLQIYFKYFTTQSAGAVEYTGRISAEGKNHLSTMSVLLWHWTIWVRLQSRSFRECGVSLHCYYSKVHTDPEWLCMYGSHLWLKKNSLTT